MNTNQAFPVCMLLWYKSNKDCFGCNQVWLSIPACEGKKSANTQKGDKVFPCHFVNLLHATLKTVV